MKRVIFATILFGYLLLGSAVSAQNIALNERTPRIKAKNIRWLDGHKPTPHAYTYIEFIHSKSEPCRLSAERIASIAKSSDNMNVILVTKEEGAGLAEWARKFSHGTTGVIVLGSDYFDRYNVKYAPFGVMIHKRRAIWFGNPRLLNKELIEKLTNTKHKRVCRTQK